VTEVEYHSLVSDFSLAALESLDTLTIRERSTEVLSCPTSMVALKRQSWQNIMSAYYCSTHSRHYQQRGCRLSTREQTGLYVPGLPFARRKGWNRQYCGYTESLPGRARLRRSVLRYPLAYMSESRLSGIR
jgi:hypothetical protein